MCFILHHGLHVSIPCPHTKTHTHFAVCVTMFTAPANASTLHCKLIQARATSSSRCFWLSKLRHYRCLCASTQPACTQTRAQVCACLAWQNISQHLRVHVWHVQNPNNVCGYLWMAGSAAMRSRTHSHIQRPVVPEQTPSRVVHARLGVRVHCNVGRSASRMGEELGHSQESVRG